MAQSASSKIIDSILYAVNHAMQPLLHPDYKTGIKAVKSTSAGTLYTVVIQGAEYDVPSGIGLTFNVGDRVWVHAPNNSLKDAYISATITPKTVTVTSTGHSIKRQDTTSSTKYDNSVGGLS